MESQWLWCDSKGWWWGNVQEHREREREKKNFFHYLEISNGVGGVHCMRWTLTNVGDLWIRRLRVAVNFSAAKDINGKKKRRNRNTGFLRSDISQTCLSLGLQDLMFCLFSLVTSFLENYSDMQKKSFLRI